jgi:hypothetical protein
MDMQLIASAWREVVRLPAYNLRIGRCTACGQRFAWPKKAEPVACLICGGPLQGTRRYSQGTRFVVLQNRADVAASRADRLLQAIQENDGSLKALRRLAECQEAHDRSLAAYWTTAQEGAKE